MLVSVHLNITHASSIYYAWIYEVLDYLKSILLNIGLFFVFHKPSVVLVARLFKQCYGEEVIKKSTERLTI